MVTKRLTGSAALVCTLASTGAFSPNSAFVCDPVQKPTYGINSPIQYGGSVTM